MDLQTRNLLSLLAEELTQSILMALRERPMTERELLERVGSSQKTVNRRLHKLQEIEAISKESSPPRKETGARPKVFRIVEETDRELMRFCDDADDFALSFQQNRAERMERRIKTKRKKRFQAIKEGDAA